MGNELSFPTDGRTEYHDRFECMWRRLGKGRNEGRVDDDTEIVTDGRGAEVLIATDWQTDEE